jgi:transcriptional regulator with GAF, ATPase, and Fis domain
MDHLIEPIGRVVATAVAQPWVTTVLAIFIIGFVAAILIMSFWKVKQGAELSIPGILQVKPNDLLERYREENEQLALQSKQKTQLIKMLQQMAVEVTKAMACRSDTEFAELCQAVYQYALPGICLVLAKQKANNHRVAVFVPESDTHLKIHVAVNFSPDGMKHLRLSIADSAAGRVLQTGEPYFCGDVSTEGNSFTAHPKASRKYLSLICVPIKVGEQIVGVLSIDGEEKDSFSREEAEYLRYFAHTLAPFLYLERYRGAANESVVSDREDHCDETSDIA